MLLHMTSFFFLSCRVQHNKVAGTAALQTEALGSGALRTERVCAAASWQTGFSAWAAKYTVNKNKRQRLCLTALCRYAIGRQQRFIMFSIFKFIICSHKMAVCLHTSVAIDLLGFSVGLCFVGLCFFVVVFFAVNDLHFYSSEWSHSTCACCTHIKY